MCLFLSYDFSSVLFTFMFVLFFSSVGFFAQCKISMSHNASSRIRTISQSRSRTMDVSGGVPVHPAKEKPPINVVGDVGGRIAIMVVSKKK